MSERVFYVILEGESDGKKLGTPDGISDGMKLWPSDCKKCRISYGMKLGASGRIPEDTKLGVLNGMKLRIYDGKSEGTELRISEGGLMVYWKEYLMRYEYLMQ